MRPVPKSDYGAYMSNFINRTECDFYHDLQGQSIYTAGDFQMQYILACQLKHFLIEQKQLIDMLVNNHLKGDLFVGMTIMIALK